MAEKALQKAVEFFEKAKFDDKFLEASNILRKVKEERQFGTSLTDIFHVPAIISLTAVFSSFASVEESAVGLERFEKAAVQVKLVPQKTEIGLGDEVRIKFQIVNVGKEPVSLIRVEDFISSGFQLVDRPNYCQFEDATLFMKGKTLKPLEMEEISFTLKSFRKGAMEVKPRIVCLDWVGHEAVFEPEPVIFNVASAVLAGRIPTGYADLDNLLLGGIPENYAVVLTSPATDEREQLIRKFLEFGAKIGQITYYISSWVGNVIDLVEKYPANFIVFVCNPRSDVMIEDLSNVYKIAGVERITDLDIALIRSYRQMDKSIEGPKRICISTVSDVLLEEHAVRTRKWLSGLLPGLRAKGFTTLAVVNPDMHPREEVQAILSLFDGEIRVKEMETQKGLEQRLRIRKLYNQQYLENEIVLTREKLED